MTLLPSPIFPEIPLPSVSQVIREYRLNACKRLGQNFLTDPHLLGRIASSSGPVSGESFFEVGPGPGGLTRALLERGAARVVVIEKDPQFLPALTQLQKAFPKKVEIFCEDALRIVPQEHFKEPFRIVSNLPYNIGVALTTQWLGRLDSILSMTLLFQKEVALRLIAPPLSLHYGRLSIFCQFLGVPTKCFDIAPGSFLPPPKVTSSLVHFEPHSVLPPLCLLSFLERLTKAAFGQRRKMIRSSLCALLTKEEIEECKIPSSVRAEELDLEKFLILARALQKKEENL